MQCAIRGDAQSVMNTQHYDLIGDIHGQYDKLEALLLHLGYAPTNATWRHPAGRKVIFLGDYIDRGPQVREVLHTVRGMVDAGDALAIMGNHEYNAVCLHTPDGNGGWLRGRSEKNHRQVRATSAAFEGRQDEWEDWLLWMKRLPMFLDLGAFRCVHACWDVKRLARLAGSTLEDDGFLRQTATKMTPEHRAVENVLKGPELPATDGNMFRDKEGMYRNTIRTRWWGVKEGLTISDLAMPPGAMNDPMMVDPVLLRRVPNYGPDEPPVFCGHYWLPADAPKTPLTSNIACLDFSAGLDGPLVAYRWNGERELNPDHFEIG